MLRARTSFPHNPRWTISISSFSFLKKIRTAAAALITFKFIFCFGSTILHTPFIISGRETTFSPRAGRCYCYDQHTAAKKKWEKPIDYSPSRRAYIITGLIPFFYIAGRVPSRCVDAPSIETFHPGLLEDSLDWYLAPFRELLVLMNDVIPWWAVKNEGCRSAPFFLLF